MQHVSKRLSRNGQSIQKLQLFIKYQLLPLEDFKLAILSPCLRGQHTIGIICKISVIFIFVDTSQSNDKIHLRGQATTL